MRTTLRKRTFSASNPRNPSKLLFKKRKLNSFHKNHPNQINVPPSQLDSLRKQLNDIKNKHGLNSSSKSSITHTSHNKSTKSTITIKSKPISSIRAKPKYKPKPSTSHNNTTSKQKPFININMINNKQMKQTKNKKQIKNKKKQINPKHSINKIKPKKKKINDKHPAKSKSIIIKNKKENKMNADKDDINNFLEIADNQTASNDEWINLLNHTDFSNKNIKQNIIKKVNNKHIKSNNKNQYLVTDAVVTDVEWNAFLDKRYGNDNDNDNDGNDSKWWADDFEPPQINKFWSQGPIGLIQNWWENNDIYVDKDLYNNHLNNNQNNKLMELTKEEISKKKQQKTIRDDIRKELKSQNLERKLRERLEFGEIVKNLDDANNPFESFFTSALQLGDDIRSGIKKEILINKKEKNQQKKTKIIKPKLKKLKDIATFENDDLFFFDDDNDDDDLNDDIKLNKNDMIQLHIQTNDVSSDNDVNILTATMLSEQELLKERIKMKHKEMVIGSNDDKRLNINKNGIISSNILSDTFEDSLKEKKLLKKLNIMDYVHNYKNEFFQEIEKLHLNPAALVENWKVIKTHTELSRKLKKQLGIVMARERAKQKRIQKMIDKFQNESSSEFDGEEDEEDDDISVVSSSVQID